MMEKNWTSLLPSWKTTLGSCLLIIATKIIAVSIYRIYWHPLAKYPGPFLAKISDWYAAYHAYTGDIHKDVFQAHRIYGTIVRYGPNRLLFSEVEVSHCIYHAKNVRKSDAYRGLLSGQEAWNVHNVLDKDVNLRKRKFLAQWLSADRLEQTEQEILHQSEIFVKTIVDNGYAEDGWTTPINMADCCKYLLFDIMSEICLGTNFNLQTEPTNRFMVYAVAPLHRFNSVFVQSLDLMKFHLEKIFYPQGLWYAWKMLKVARQFSASKLECTPKVEENLLSLLYKEKDPKTGRPLSATQIISELKFVMVTGAGSPATALASTLFYLVRNPPSYERVVEEIRTAFLDPSEIHSGSKMASCRYIQACITESLRMSPPVSGMLWRRVEDGGLVISGERIDPGYDVGTGIYTIHHQEEYFPEAFSFKPERWLPDESKTGIRLAAKAFSTFSLGPRSCLGRGLAMMELCDILAMLLWNFDIRRPRGNKHDIGGGGGGEVDENEFQLEDHIVSFFDGPCIEFRRRLF